MQPASKFLSATLFLAAAVAPLPAPAAAESATEDQAYHAGADLAPYLQLVGKTSGWVAGQVELQKNLQTVAGLESTL